MSGDVQPRKRKDKKKKKDELSLDEPRGTAAALGEGDVFMHSYHDHGTGGHWCAKIIFFSLLAVLITLIGLIILENRGLSELEANAVESRYSGILEGWLEEAPDDDHHDAHTLELKHHDADEDHIAHDEDDDEPKENQYVDDNGDDEDEDNDQDEDGELNDDHEEDEDDEDENGAGDDQQNEGEDEENYEQDSEQNLDEPEDEDQDDRVPYKYYDQDDDGDNDEDDDKQKDNDEDSEDLDEQNEDQDNYRLGQYEHEQDIDGAHEYNQEDDDNHEFDRKPTDEDQENEDQEDEDQHEDEDEEDELELEKIEQEALEEDREPISNELPALPEEDDDDDDDDGKDDNDDDENDSEADNNDNDDEADSPDDDGDDADDDFLEADDEPPIVERITAPAGKPYPEVDEDEDSTEKPPDTLEEEEEYEKQQEELRKEEEQSSHMWLKLSVGGALLLATHAVMRRATAPSDEGDDEHVSREATPIDRRMTLIPEEETPVIPKKVEETKKQVVPEKVKQAPVFKAPQQATRLKQQIEEKQPEEYEEIEEEEPEEFENEDEKAELYSDDEEVIVPQKTAPKRSEPPKHRSEAEPEDDVPDDVEIIDDEQIEEEISEDDEEDVSDVDDAELLKRLEAKYGRLPEPDRPGPKQKDGGNSINDEWPGEPADSFWRTELDSVERQLREGMWAAAMERASAPQLQGSARARYVIAAALDRLAEAQRDNRLLSRAIAAYLEVLKMSESLSNKKLIDVAKRTLDRIKFRGNYLSAEPVYRLLIRRFPNEPGYRNNLTISYLMANRADLAEDVLKETLKRWPNDRVALAHYGFVLKVNNNKLEEAVDMFKKALEGDKGPACEPRFYYHYGDALLLLGRFKEAHELHKRAAKHGHFLSASQRSLYNVPSLKSKPWWNVEETPYLRLAKALERSWKEILKEGEAAKALYEKEKEGLKERGEWSQMDLFVQGHELPGRCKQAPVTCSVVKSEVAAAGCRRGQVKFSAMEAGTHVRPHVGPTNCRLRMHLGLSNTKDTYLRVDQETRQWQEGRVLLFDDSFEHEVWHNGTGKRMVLIVDVWHPDLTPHERRTLPAI